MNKKLFLLFGIAIFCLHFTAIRAQDLPNKTIKIIVPFPPGGGNDAIARIIANKLSINWGKTVIVDNRSGAGGNVGAETVYTSTPDGTTLLLTTQGPLVVNKSLYQRISYDSDLFVPISLIAVTNSFLVLNQKLPINSLTELIKYAKSNPNKINYASQGIGSAAHLAAELFSSMADVKLTHVPYKGTGPAIVDLISGQIDVMFAESSSTSPLIQSSKLKLIAIGSEKRNLQNYPDIPTVDEFLPGFLAMTWYGLVAPPSTPPNISAFLSTSIINTINQSDVNKSLKDIGVTPVGSSPKELISFMKQEQERWGKVIKLTGSKAD